jgi:hypothetical protein
VASRLAGRSAGLGQASPEAAPLLTTVLRDEQNHTAPFAANREALDEPKRDEDDGNRRPDRGVRRKQSDQECRAPHQQEAEHQQVLATEPVTEVAEHDAADRPGHEPDRIGQEGQHGADQRIGLGEEQHVKDQRRGRAVEQEIVPMVVPTMLASTTFRMEVFSVVLMRGSRVREVIRVGRLSRPWDQSRPRM